MKRHLFCALAVLLPQLCFAGPITFNFSLNTSPLISSPAGPFSIDFQFTDGSGSGDANNTVTIGSFAFGGGATVGSPILIGGATGSLSGQVLMIDSSFFNEFIQTFTPGASLSFQAISTTNVDTGGAPDEFSFAILDSTGVEIPTLGLVVAGSDVFLNLNIDSPNPSVQAFASDSARSPAAGGPPINTGTPTVTAGGTTPTPEPSTVILIGLVLGVLLKQRTIAAR